MNGKGSCEQWEMMNEREWRKKYKWQRENVAWAWYRAHTTPKRNQLKFFPTNFQSHTHSHSAKYSCCITVITWSPPTPVAAHLRISSPSLFRSSRFFICLLLLQIIHFLCHLKVTATTLTEAYVYLISVSCFSLFVFDFLFVYSKCVAASIFFYAGLSSFSNEYSTQWHFFLCRSLSNSFYIMFI